MNFELPLLIDDNLSLVLINQLSNYEFNYLAVVLKLWRYNKFHTITKAIWGLTNHLTMYRIT